MKSVFKRIFGGWGTCTNPLGTQTRIISGRIEIFINFLQPNPRLSTQQNVTFEEPGTSQRLY